MAETTQGHDCRPDFFCRCGSLALEPAPECPVHGYTLYRPACVHCGRFMPRAAIARAEGGSRG